MFAGWGWGEWLLVLVIVLIIFGVGRLPEVGGALGKAIREFRSESKTGSDKAEEADKAEGAEKKEENA
jgi:sec-independent protein translocase protein TatA